MSADSEATANPPHAPKRISLILTVWAETQPDRLPVWRGYIEMAHAQRLYFNTLGKLDRLLIDLGWNDPPAS
jgi:hypothetical protein